jgi:hypothetical protein
MITYEKSKRFPSGGIPSAGCKSPLLVNGSHPLFIKGGG